MKRLFGNVVTFFDHGRQWLWPSNANDATHVIIPGYIAPEGEDLQEPSSGGDLNRRQAGIFYADIANYTRLTEKDEEGTHLRLVKAIRIMLSHVAENNGRIAHIAGDAILAEFKDADSALHCAINVQLAARQWNADLNHEEQVLFRIGVNFGEVIADQGDIYGNAVNLAARLEQLASSGGICVSESVRREFEDHPSISFVAMGKQYVKNISEPVQAFWIEVDSQQVIDAGLTNAVKVSAAVT